MFVTRARALLALLPSLFVQGRELSSLSLSLSAGRNSLLEKIHEIGERDDGTTGGKFVVSFVSSFTGKGMKRGTKE